MPGALADVAGGVTAVTGFEKGSGKTTLLGALRPLARRAGPVALFGIGVDGSLKAGGDGRAAVVRVEEGDVVQTTDLFARASSARLEILDVLPSRTSLGRLLLGRAVRAGEVTLVGDESLSALSRSIDLVRDEQWAASVLVDGAASRITQAAALDGVRFLYTVRVDGGNLSRVAERVRALAALAMLPVVPEPSEGTFRVEGPLTEEGREALPRDLGALSLEDLTKSFLPPRLLLRLLETVACSVRRGIALLGVVALRRDVTAEELRAAVGPVAAPFLLPSPFEAAA
ncbi:MAG TPA: hypothetical protein PLL76_08570 [Thermoanaerobaculia bacterium]|nr:hypothetical protein [Thermoanaerobaculia bacterium]HQP86295.1 hypothetical protein [Thermoanaerobaculia bacterium]